MTSESVYFVVEVLIATLFFHVVSVKPDEIKKTLADLGAGKANKNPNDVKGA